MSRDAYNAFCARLTATTHVVQWGESDVWKVGGKVFAIGLHFEGDLAVSFKVSEIAFEVLSDAPGCRPAPYLASRGMKWIQWTGTETLDWDGLCEHIAASHALVASGLSKKKRVELGIAT